MRHCDCPHGYGPQPGGYGAAGGGFINDGPRYDIVITTAYRGSTGAAKNAAAAFAAAWKPVEARGSRVVAIADVPAVSEDAMNCVNRLSFSVHSDCATPRDQAFHAKDYLPDAVKRAPGVALANLRPFLCNENQCPTVIGNVIVYRDTLSHLTATFSQTLGPYLVDAVNAAAQGR